MKSERLGQPQVLPTVETMPGMRDNRVVTVAGMRDPNWAAAKATAAAMIPSAMAYSRTDTPRISGKKGRKERPVDGRKARRKVRTNTPRAVGSALNIAERVEQRT